MKSDFRSVIKGFFDIYFDNTREAPLSFKRGAGGELERRLQ